MPSDNPPRIELIDASSALLEAALDDAQLSALLDGAVIAPGWLDFPEALESMRKAYRDAPSPTRRTMIGWGGYKGAPSDDGEVEIGYAIAPAFQGRGLATLAAQIMVARAFDAPRVTSVIAHTLPEKNASVRILEKLGFVFAGVVEEEGHGEVWRWRLRRS